jgi:lipid-A-disaccharide synthase
LKYFVLAGEASGDKQGALLCEAILQKDTNAVIKGWGGEEMMSKGVMITKHYRELAYMGFIEVVKHLPAIMRNFKTCRKEILDFNPDALILVDYPGFNLRMASWAHKENIRVYYYISPQLWAWHTSRVHKIKDAVRRMYVILPFEKEFYAKYGVDAMYIGHPLAMSISNEIQHPIEIKKGQIALLPGSRKHEVELILPEMAELAKLAPDLFFKIVAVNHLPIDLYKNIIGNQKNMIISEGNMHQVLRESEAAIVTSGTATLETALLGTPQVVVYKGNRISYQLARRLVKVPFISLVNLIHGGKLVPELIQDDCNSIKMLANLIEVLKPDTSSTIRAGYKHISAQLTSGGGPASAASDIFTDIYQTISKNGQI